jgi:hypothetical protein
MSDHALFLDRFVARLRAQEDADPRFAVYRNTFMRGTIDALKIAYPSVVTLCGDIWFDGIARRFALDTPPVSPVLIAYGQGFPDFIAALPPDESLPYLDGIARIDRLWLEAHTAEDAAPLTAAALSGADVETLPLRLHPALRLAHFAIPAPSIWQCTRAGEPAKGIEWHAEAILLTRPRGDVLSAIIGVSALAFLDAIRTGAALGAAAEAALAADPTCPLHALIADLLQRGAFAA